MTTSKIQKSSILGRMAVLWKQKELVRTLRTLQLEELKDHASEFKKNSWYPSVLLCGDGVWWIEENVLIDRLLKNNSKDIHDWDELLGWRLIVNASLEKPNDFLIEQKNGKFDKEAKNHNLINTSQRLLSINPDNGTEIVDDIYFWGKYMAEQFPPLTTIVVTIITTVITSGAIWLYLLGMIDDKLQLNNEQPTTTERQEKISALAK